MSTIISDIGGAQNFKSKGRRRTKKLIAANLYLLKIVDFQSEDVMETTLKSLHLKSIFCTVYVICGKVIQRTW